MKQLTTELIQNSYQVEELRKLILQAPVRYPVLRKQALFNYTSNFRCTLWNTKLCDSYKL